MFIHANFVKQTLPKIIEIITRCIAYANENIPDDKKRDGCYLTILDRETGNICLVMPIGKFPLEKAEKYSSFSLGKARKLYSMLGQGHLTSRESANDSNGFPPGAVTGGTFIFSISGQESDVDEAITIILARADYANLFTPEKDHEYGLLMWNLDMRFNGGPLKNDFFRKMMWRLVEEEVLDEDKIGAIQKRR